MNTDNLSQLLQQGFQISVGATTSFLEPLQDPQKRSKTISDIHTQLIKKAQEWAQKGETTEQEARRLMNEWLNQQQYQHSSTSINRNDYYKLTLSSGGNKNAQGTIKKLTEQVISLRTELENLRRSNQNNK
ncbi:MAG: hypothetical protein ACQJCO_03295 [cyanobacterium endosymbiont of Rhopalodia sterrenbergii]